MSRLPIPALKSASGATAEIYAQIRKAIGNVPNTFAAIGAYRPEALKAILSADSVLASGTLSRRDQETIKLVLAASPAATTASPRTACSASSRALPPRS